MADLIIAAGERANALAYAKSITVSDEDAIFTKVYLYDGRPSKQFRFGSNGANRTITVDLDQLLRGDFETSTLVGWTDASTGGGSTAETVVGAEVHAGTKALKCTGAIGGVGARYRDLTVRAGQRRTLDAWMRSDGTGIGRITVQNLKTGKYLTSAGAWSTVVDLFTHATTTYTAKTRAYQVESIALCQALEVTLRITCYVTNQAQAATFDDVADYPTLNLCSVHGHNFAPVVSPLFESSPDNSAWTTEATMTAYQPSFYGSPTAFAKRYARLKLSGTNDATPWVGELFMGYGEAMLRRPNLGGSFQIGFYRPTVESEAGGGDRWSLSIGSATRRTFGLEFDFNNDAAKEEARLEVFERSMGSRHPLVIIPDSTKTDVLHGRIDSTWQVTRTFVTYFTGNALTVLEDPFPVQVG